MPRYKYIAHLDWGTPMTLTYDGPIVELALAEARRRCIRPDEMRWVQKQTYEMVHDPQKAAT